MVGRLVARMACVVLGGVLIARPFGSLLVLHWLVAVALIVIGVTKLFSAAASPRPVAVVGDRVGWIVAGVLAVPWPGITLYALAVVLGIALVLGGGVKIAGAFFGRGEQAVDSRSRRAYQCRRPAGLELALGHGAGVGARRQVGTALFGIGQIALAVKLRGAQPDSGGAR